jgi:CubicO group peptidase (beta-lactamase class C family)
VALVKESQVVYARGFGARNLKDNLPATPQTLYGIGSCTKSFTALAMMQLAEQGKLNVHDPVSKYLSLKIGNKDDPITIHHLLTHSSGRRNSVSRLARALISCYLLTWNSRSEQEEHYIQNKEQSRE